MNIEFTPAGELERIQKADKEIAATLKKYQVEFAADYACEMWLEPKKATPPKLEVVKDQR